MSSHLRKLEKQQTLRKQASSLSERVEALEKQQNTLINAINQQLGPVPSKLNALAEILDALVAMDGFTAKDIQEQITATKNKEAKDLAEAQKAALAEGLSNGYFTVTDTVAEKTIVSGTERTVKGDLVQSMEMEGQMVPVVDGRVQLIYEAVKPHVQVLFKGRKVGDTVDMPTGGKFVVEEVYAVDEEKMRAHFTQSMQNTVDAVSVPPTPTEAPTASEAETANV